MGSGEVFHPLIGPLSEFCNPVTVDLLGHGRSGGGNKPEQYHAEKQVRHLYSILRRLQLHPLILHGYSMGGRLALQFALQYPGYYELLVLESTHAGLSDSEDRSKRQKMDEERARALQDNFDEFLTSWQRMPLFLGTQSPIGHLSNYETIMQNQNPEYLSASLRGFGAGTMPPVFGELNKITKPVRLLAGEKDQKYCTKMKRMLRQFPDAELQIIAGAGHRVHLDQAENFVNQIKTFTNKKLNYELDNR